jgi:hypothetical protein
VRAAGPLALAAALALFGEAAGAPLEAPAKSSMPPKPRPASVKQRPAPLAPFDSVARRLIAPAGFRALDLDLLINYRREIPPALPAVETLLRRPAAVDSLVPALRRDLEAGDAARLWAWLGARETGIAPWPDPPPLQVYAGLLESILRDYLSPLSPEETDYLAREAPALFRASAEDTSRTPVQMELDRLRGEAVTDSVMALARRLRLSRLAIAADNLEGILDGLRRALGQGGVEEVEAQLRHAREAGVPVSLGTRGDDVHRLSRGIVFDPGGNDRYEFADSARAGNWLLVFDLAGDDVYRAADTVGGAAALLSAQILHDAAGNDRYEGADFAFGAALMGYARLFDGRGDDEYAARSASLGFAFQGIGILEDRAGDDRYASAYHAQGAAGPGGLAVLLDHAGNDRYVSLPVFPDDLRYRDHYLSLSQGFSTGLAPRHAGGIGVLWDRGGNDVYRSDIFGQGAGYWFAWGLLMDDAGNDSTTAYQYAQGAGVHFAAGTLWDLSGNDVRVSKGVSQGCGHDGGFGLLADLAGDDRAVAVDMSAGAGSANGLGVYADLAGRDVYDMAQPRRTLGHADMRRDRGSLGFFLDAGPGKGPDVLPAEGDFTEGAVRSLYEGKHQGYGYGLDAR